MNKKEEMRAKYLEYQTNLPRFVNQDLFFQILPEFGDGYEPSEVKNKVYEIFEKTYKYENNTFKIHKYDWDDTKRYANDIEKDPCFYHKPSGFKMTWYKYPLRDVEANMKLTSEQFASILYDVRESIDNENGHHITYDIGNEKWWKNKQNKNKINNKIYDLLDGKINHPQAVLTYVVDELLDDKQRDLLYKKMNNTKEDKER